MEYIVECGKDLELFWERNKSKFDSLDIHDVRFVAFHVTGSLDDCDEIQKHGIGNLQYVLSCDTTLSKLLGKCDIHFDIESRTMIIGKAKYNIDYDFYLRRGTKSLIEERLESVAYRIYYDFCIDGFMYNDNVENYGTDIHKRPEFITTLIELSPKAEKLDAYWKSISKPYKVFFYAVADQIHKFTFDLEENCNPYTVYEQDAVKKWMVINAVDRAFEPCHECVLYVRDNVHILPEQIIRCEIMDLSSD